MTIFISKKDGEIITQFKDGDDFKDFDYIKLVEAIYNGEKLDLKFENLDVDEEDKIKELYCKIEEKSQPNILQTK